MRVGTPSGVVVYTCGGSARVGTWPHRGKLEGGLSTTPVDGAEQCACAEWADWKQVWVKESELVSAPQREGDTAHGLESVGGREGGHWQLPAT